MKITGGFEGLEMTILDGSGPHSDIWYSARTRVVNLHQAGIPAGAVYIGRAGKGQEGYFGNPFTVGYNSREKVLDLYEGWLKNELKLNPNFAAKVKELSGKTLVCFCIPKLCHGMILARYADELSNT